MIWLAWIKEVVKLESAFSRKQTFFWAILVLISMTINTDPSGITSFIRCLKLHPSYYPRILGLFNSSSINLEFLTTRWCKICFSVSDKFLVTVDDKFIFPVDTIYAPKEGTKMPGVKSLYQSSENNSKPRYIMGHACQMIGVIAKGRGLGNYFLIPLVMRIFGGIKNKNGKIENTYDCAAHLMSFLSSINKTGYIVADAYYCVKKMFLHTLNQGMDIVCRLKINAVAYEEPSAKEGRGRPRLYGEKVILKSLFENLISFKEIEVFIYGKKEKVKVLTHHLIMRSLKQKVQYCLVIKGNTKMILMTTNLGLSAEKIIEIYGLRFKIESCFRHFVHVLNGFMYKFWSKCLDKIRRKDSAQDISHKTEIEQKSILKKIRSYQIFLQFVVIAQGIIRCLALLYTDEIFASSTLWLRTQRRDRVPSDMVIRNLLRDSFFEFSASKDFDLPCLKFLREKQKKANSNEEDSS